jgi:hypothetical protein
VSGELAGRYFGLPGASVWQASTVPRWNTPALTGVGSPSNVLWYEADYLRLLHRPDAQPLLTHVNTSCPITPPPARANGG